MVSLKIVIVHDLGLPVVRIDFWQNEVEVDDLSITKFLNDASYIM